MYRTVLVPLDGSPLAERALPFARALARRTGGRLLLVRSVCVAPSLVPDLPVVQAAAAECTAYLRRVAASVEAGPPPPLGQPAGPAGRGVETEIAVSIGPPGEQILGAAREHRVDAIVMTTHGRSGLGRCLYGCVADAVLRRAEAPVLLVPVAGAGHAWRGEDTLRVVVPLDGSPAAEAVLEAIRPLAAGPRVRILLLRVVEPRLPWPDGPAFGPTPAIDQTPEVAAARRYLETVADALRPTGAALAVYATIGYPASEIAAQAQGAHADLVAMTTWGRAGPAPGGLGGVAAATVQLSSVPLLLVRPDAPPRASAATQADVTPATAPAAHPGAVPMPPVPAAL
jgi:nucleotide-binding universal stress UspA family protein